MKGDLDVLVRVAMSSVGHLSLTERLRVYRAAATLVGDQEQAAILSKLASELEAVNQRCFAFERQFQSPPPGGNPA